MRVFQWLVVAGALVSGGSAVASEPPALFTLADPKGDDHGDGALVFPLREDLQPGDLDLVSVTARPDGEGTEFEVAFAKAISRPNAREIDSVGGTLEKVAKLGFYTFNVDLYIDTDRQPNSGITSMLPGRLAEVDPAFAWEKAICLTPQPFDARSALRRMTRSALLQELKGGAGKPSKGTLDERVFFPTRARVVNHAVRFTVPSSFLGGRAQANWAYVVVLTGADLRQRLDVQSFGLFVNADNTGSLAVIPIAGGPTDVTFGGVREGDPYHPPIVDLIAPLGRTQEEILRDDDPKAGRPVRLPGVVPEDVAAGRTTLPSVRPESPAPGTPAPGTPAPQKPSPEASAPGTPAPGLPAPGTPKAPVSATPATPGQ